MPVHKTINSSSLLFAKDMIFGKRLTSNNLKMNSIMLNVEQLKMKYLECYTWGTLATPLLLYFSLYHLSNSSKSLKSCNSFTLMLLSYFLGLPTGRAVSSFFLVFQQITSSLNMWWYVFTQKRIGRSLFSFYFSSFLSFEKLWYSLVCHMINFQNYKAF